MDVTVVGAGAVGMLTACLLEESGCRVSLLTRSRRQANLLTAEGVSKDGVQVRVGATTDWQTAADSDLVVIAVKSGDLAGLQAELNRLPAGIPVVFLQNGMLHPALAASLPQSHIAAGSVEHGVKRTGEAAISHTGPGTVRLALLKGDTEVFRPLLEMSSFPAVWHGDADAMLFRKVLLNCLINPLTAVLGVKNGELLTNPHANRLLKNLYLELEDAVPEVRQLLPFSDVEALCRSTALNTSSMLTDRLAGKQMELEAIVGYTLKRAEGEVPVLETLYYLLKATEVD